MQQLRGDLFHPLYDSPPWWRGITTNGYVRKDGQAVMGRGVALQAKTKWPDLPARLGAHLQHEGNTVHFFSDLRCYTFPVKAVWDRPALPSLILESAEVLAAWARSCPEERFLLVRPGCGNGQLKWQHVEPLIAPVLPDNVYIIERF